MDIMEINELLAKIFQQECDLVEDANSSSYKLQFPHALSVTDFEAFRANCERFLSQYDIETGATIIFYSKESDKIFALPLKKWGFKKLEALSRDNQLHAALHPYGVLRVKEILDKGANINSENIVGDTVLHIAVRKGYDSIVSLLIEKGALILPNNTGETPLQIADQKNDTLMAKVLINTVLKDPKTVKPDFSRQQLSSYWDELRKKGLVKLPTQAVPPSLEETPGGVAKITSGERKIRNIIQLFSSESSVNNDKQLEGPLTVANLSK